MHVVLQPAARRRLVLLPPLHPLEDIQEGRVLPEAKVLLRVRKSRKTSGTEQQLHKETAERSDATDPPSMPWVVKTAVPGVMCRCAGRRRAGRCGRRMRGLVSQLACRRGPRHEPPACSRGVAWISRSSGNARHAATGVTTAQDANMARASGHINASCSRQCTQNSFIHSRLVTPVNRRGGICRGAARSAILLPRRWDADYG